MQEALRRAITVLLILAASLAVATVTPAARGQEAGDQTPPPTGRNVLVIYQKDDDDRENGGKPDSQALAEYYAARRNVPKENLLGLTLKKDGKAVAAWDYRTLFDRVLRPTADKLAEGVEGKPLSDRILFIVTLPGVPVSFDFGFNEKDSKDWWHKTTSRSVDQFLVSLNANIKAGLDEKANMPGPGQTKAGPLGSQQFECMLPIYGAFGQPGKPVTWARWKADHAATADFYLVTRLGLDAATGRDMLDGALYAERFLRLPGPDEKTNYRPAIWLDHKPAWGVGDQVASMNAAIALVQNAAGPTNPFGRGRGLEQAWPLVIDNQDAEVGSVAKGQPEPHPPMVIATIKKDADAVDETSVALDGPAAPGKPTLPAVLFFPHGGSVTCGAATATVVGWDAAKNRLRLSSTKGFAAGQTIRWVWPGKFPATDCFIFYGFYGLNRYEDVFQFLPGAVGVHVDSACMTWARGAMQRGIAGTFGVTTEPLSIGIPHGHLMLAALANGSTWAEAIYNSLMLSQRWAGVTLGDPLYRPFASLQKVATSRPALEAVAAKSAGGEVRISARLGGASDDELADVAMFKVEYGLTKAYGQSVDFFDWPDPASNTAPGRRFGYSRRFSTRLAKLERGKTYHFRVTVRNPAGLETVSPDGTFSP